MFRSGFTLIELLVVLVILAVVVLLIVSATGIGASEYDAKLVQKWTDVDYEGNPVYRAQFVKSDDEVVTVDSFWYHNDLHKDSYYKIRVFGGRLTGITPQPQPVIIEAKDGH